MRQRFLGGTGLRVSELCLGAMTFGGGADEPASHRMLDTFVEAGGTFVDTADVYGKGVSEEILGRWLKDRRRDELVIATKVFGTMGEAPNAGGLGRKHILSAVDASLRRLGTDHIDLYQTHVWDASTPIEETLSTLDTLVTMRQGPLHRRQQSVRGAAPEVAGRVPRGWLGALCVPSAAVQPAGT